MDNDASYGTRDPWPTQAWDPSTAPDPSALRRAKAELTRCLRLLVGLFPDPEFNQTSPEVCLERYAPLPEQCFRPAGHRSRKLLELLRNQAADLVKAVKNHLIRLYEAPKQHRLALLDLITAQQMELL